MKLRNSEITTGTSWGALEKKTTKKHHLLIFDVWCVTLHARQVMN